MMKYTSAVALLLGSSKAHPNFKQNPGMQNKVYDWLSPSEATTVSANPIGIGGPAPCLESYTQAINYAVDDMHLKMGFEAKKDKAIVAVGAGRQLTDGEAGIGNDGLVFKFDRSCKPSNKYNYQGEIGDPSKCQKTAWMATLGTRDKQTELVWVAESTDGSYYAVGGFTETDSKGAQATLWKLDAVTGQVIWTSVSWQDLYDKTKFSDAFEAVAFTPDGGLIVAGVIGINIRANAFQFKSGGQQDAGHPFIAKISAADMNSSTPPQSFEWFYQEMGFKDGVKTTYKGSVKSLRVDQNGNIYGLFGTGIAVIKLDPNGNVLAKAADINPNGVQGGDIEITADGGVVVTGLAGMKPSGVLRAAITKLDPVNFKTQWFKQHGNYPGGINKYKGLDSDTSLMVIDECWGMSTTKDSNGTPNGYAMACGTGIEKCPPGTPNDPRCTWRSLVVGTDLEGNMIWYRQDNFQTPDSGIQGDKSSAAEYVFAMDGGKIGIVTDEANGAGIEVLSAPNGQQCTQTPNWQELFTGLAQQPSSLSQMSSNKHYQRRLAQKSIRDKLSLY